MALDNETGETMQLEAGLLSESSLDMETGEMTSDEMEMKQSGIRKSKFSIPKQYLSKPEKPKPNRCCLSPCETYSLTSKEKVLELKEVS